MKKVIILQDTTLTQKLDPEWMQLDREKLPLKTGQRLGVEAIEEFPGLGRWKICLVNSINGCRDWWIPAGHGRIEDAETQRDSG